MMAMPLINGLYLGISRRWPSPASSPAPMVKAVVAYAIAGAAFVFYPLLNLQADPLMQALAIAAFFAMGLPVWIALLRVRSLGARTRALGS
jgi:hypothetical protein